MSKDLKKVIQSVFIVLVSLIIIDFCVGKIYAAMYNRITSHSGETGSMVYSMTKSNEDVVLLGSSRCSHHYNPEIIAKAFPGQSIINLGRDGIDFAYSCCQLKAITQREPQKHHTFIIDMNSTSLSTHAFYHTDVLHPFYNRDYVKNVVLMSDSLVNMKYLSSLYKYNGDIFRVLRTIYVPADNKNKGYLPLPNVRAKLYFNESARDNGALDKAACEQLKEIIKMVKSYHNDLILVMSPIYERVDKSTSPTLCYLDSMCRQNSVPFYNFSNEKSFMGNDVVALFKDGSHLNRDGADWFSKLLTKEIMKFSYWDK